MWTGYKQAPVAPSKTADELLDDILDTLAVVDFKAGQLHGASVRNRRECARKRERIAAAVKALAAKGLKAPT